MQLKSIFFLIAFIWCILTPALVTFCNIDTNLSALFSMNEEETSETYKLGAKEYNTPEFVTANFLSAETFESSKVFGYKSLFWESLSQETVSPPPDYN